MKILFSPSEAKNCGGVRSKLNNNSFIFPSLFEKREEVLKSYAKFINSASFDSLSKLFGTKNKKQIDYYSGDIHNKEILKVVERYAGVAYKYLEYENLAPNAKEYVDKNVIIFSNLYGPLLAGDFGVVDYKLKQGERIERLEIESFYKKQFTQALDEYLKDEDVLDLRAEFYQKFYSLQKPHTTLKFVKNGKVVSHWAKAYRGVVLKEIAKVEAKNIDEFLNLQIDKLKVSQIKEHKLKKEIVFEIID